MRLRKELKRIVKEIEEAAHKCSSLVMHSLKKEFIHSWIMAFIWGVNIGVGGKRCAFYTHIPLGNQGYLSLPFPPADSPS